MSTVSALAQVENTNRTGGWLSVEGVHKKWGYGATEQLRLEADKGDPNAMFGMWVMSDPGASLSTANIDAMRWLQRAAEGGHSEAQCYLGHSLEYNKPGDIAQAVHWYKLSAGQHHPGGENHLAFCYLRGKGVEKDEQRGLELMREAADQGHAFSMAHLADLYARGIGEPRDENDRTIALLLRAANLGLTRAYDSLSLRYRQGLGTDQNLISAAHWYCERAIAGPFLVPTLMEILRTRPNPFLSADPFDETLRLFCRAMQMDDAAAALALGRLYANGEHVPMNAASAWQWFNLAASEGSSEAASLRAQPEQQMSADELAAAKSRAGAFRAGLEALASKLPEIHAQTSSRPPATPK